MRRRRIVAKLMCLPGICILRPAEENLRQFAIGCFGQTPIEGTECEPEPVDGVVVSMDRCSLKTGLDSACARVQRRCALERGVYNATIVMADKLAEALGVEPSKLLQRGAKLKTRKCKFP
jgi:hypothetical protein